MTSHHFDLSDLIDIPAVNAMLENLYQTIPFATAIIDMEGKVLIGVGWQRICLELHRKHPEAERLCIESDTHLRDETLSGEPFVVYECPYCLFRAIEGGAHLARLQNDFDILVTDHTMPRKQGSE